MDEKNTKKVTGLPTLLARRTTRTESGNGTDGTGWAEKLPWRLKKGRWTEAGQFYFLKLVFSKSREEKVKRIRWLSAVPEARKTNQQRYPHNFNPTCIDALYTLIT